MKKIFYVIILIILSSIEQYQIKKIMILLYSEEIATVFSFSFIFIYIVLSSKTDKFFKIVLTLCVFILLSLSYYNNINETLEEIKFPRKEKIDKLKEEIYSLEQKIISFKPIDCFNFDGNKYKDCIYTNYLNRKEHEFLKIFLQERIKKIQNDILYLESEPIDRSPVYIKIAVSFATSFFIAIAILEISSKIFSPDKEHPKGASLIKKLFSKGYSIQEISKKLKISRATIYRRLQNEKQPK